MMSFYAMFIGLALNIHTRGRRSPPIFVLAGDDMEPMYADDGSYLEVLAP